MSHAKCARTVKECRSCPSESDERSCVVLLTPLEFVASFVSYGQFLTTFSAACSQYTTTVSGSHSLQEAVFVTTLTLGRLECTFHCFIKYLCSVTERFYAKWTAKVLLFSDITKFFRTFFTFVGVFSQKPPLKYPRNGVLPMFRRVPQNTCRVPVTVAAAPYAFAAKRVRSPSQNPT